MISLPSCIALSRSGKTGQFLISLHVRRQTPDNGRTTDMKTNVCYEIHSKRGHVRLTDDKVDVRDALNKNLMVVEVQEMTMYLTDSIVKTSVCLFVDVCILFDFSFSLFKPSFHNMPPCWKTL